MGYNDEVTAAKVYAMSAIVERCQTPESQDNPLYRQAKNFLLNECQAPEHYEPTPRTPPTDAEVIGLACERGLEKVEYAIKNKQADAPIYEWALVAVGAICLAIGAVGAVAVIALAN